jgi:hypothetical protein
MARTLALIAALDGVESPLLRARGDECSVRITGLDHGGRVELLDEHGVVHQAFEKSGTFSVKHLPERYKVKKVTGPVHSATSVEVLKNVETAH